MKVKISGYDYIVIHKWGDSVDEMSLNSFSTEKNAISYIKKDVKKVVKSVLSCASNDDIIDEVSKCYVKGEGRNDYWHFECDGIQEYWEFRKIPHQVSSTWIDPEYTAEYEIVNN